MSFKIPSNDTDKKAISKKDMLKIINASDIAEDWTDTHNYIVFSYLAGGMNFMDIAYLQWDSKDSNIDDNYIQYIRKKTENKKKKIKLRVKIRPEIKNILDHYHHYNPRHKGYVFPIIIDMNLKPSIEYHRIRNAEAKANDQLKKIAKSLGVKDAEKLSFYSFRHTFATVLKKEGKSTEIIGESMGHADIRTTKAYLDSFDQDVLDAAFEDLL